MASQPEDPRVLHLHAAVAPIVGAARVASAGGSIMEALGGALDHAETVAD